MEVPTKNSLGLCIPPGEFRFRSNSLCLATLIQERVEGIPSCSDPTEWIAACDSPDSLDPHTTRRRLPVQYSLKGLFLLHVCHGLGKMLTKCCVYGPQLRVWYPSVDSFTNASRSVTLFSGEAPASLHLIIMRNGTKMVLPVDSAPILQMTLAFISQSHLCVLVHWRVSNPHFDTLPMPVDLSRNLFQPCLFSQ